MEHQLDRRETEIISLPKMTAIDWLSSNHFKSHGTADRWGDPYQIAKPLVELLDALRSYVGKPVLIHCGFQLRDKFSWHNYGLAVDLHIEGMHVTDQFLAASRLDEINGLGVYPWWNNPGLHIDLRPRNLRFKPDARWGSKGPGVYVALDHEFLFDVCA